MGWAAVDNKYQVYENKPKKAFEKAKKVYGKWMEDAPKKTRVTPSITTNFDELLSLRKRNATRYYINLRIAGVFTALGLSLFLIVFILEIMGRLS